MAQSSIKSYAPEEITPEQLEKIGRYTRREFAPEELYVFSAVLCDNQIDRDGERFSEECLGQLAELFIGVTGIFDHEPRAAGQHARIFDTHVTEDPSQPTNCGRPYTALTAEIYMLRSGAGQELIDEIDAGIKKEISVSCAVSRSVCSVCGARAGSCSHVRGKEYDGRPCHVVHESAADAYEWSFVAVPAQPRAGVTKRARLAGDGLGEEYLTGLGRRYLKRLREECIRLSCIAVPELSRTQAESMAAGLDPEELEGCVETLHKAAARRLPLSPQLGAGSGGKRQDSSMFKM
ncbi:MAG: hypothetical protein KH009_05635 [Clostridiales bacterium]|nr:hypothetical protein [Clostridiales bacterium]